MTEYHFFVAIKVYIIKSSLFIRNVIEIFLKGCHGNTKTPPTKVCSRSLCIRENCSNALTTGPIWTIFG